MSFQSFPLRHLVIVPVNNSKKQHCFTGSKFVPHNNLISQRGQACIKVFRNSEVVKISCISETTEGLSSLGAQEPVPGYWHKMVLCSYLEYQKCNCVHSDPISHRVRRQFLNMSVQSKFVPNFTVYRGSTQTTTKFPLSFRTWMWFLGIQL